MERDRIFDVIVALAILNIQTIQTVIKRSDPSLTQTSILRRTQVAPNLDLVVALASARTQTGAILWRGEKERFGLFLQEQSNPGRVFILTLTPGVPDCSVRILRATAADTVVQCTCEKSAPRHKLRIPDNGRTATARPRVAAADVSSPAAAPAVPVCAAGHRNPSRRLHSA